MPRRRLVNNKSLAQICVSAPSSLIAIHGPIPCRRKKERSFYPPLLSESVLFSVAPRPLSPFSERDGAAYGGCLYDLPGLDDEYHRRCLISQIKACG